MDNHANVTGAMTFTTAEKIRILCKRRNMTLARLAHLTGQSRTNLSNKLARNNLSEKDLVCIARALGCEYFSGFKLLDTEELL